MSGTRYSIPNASTNAGGANVFPTGGGLALVSSIGLASVTKMTSATYVLNPGVVATQRPASANLDSSHAYPVPYMPSRGHDRITFTRLPAKTTIRIYTISGELVKTLMKDSGSVGKIIWFPVYNESGEKMASGVYLYVMESSDGQKKIGKLMVIK